MDNMQTLEHSAAASAAISSAASKATIGGGIATTFSSIIGSDVFISAVALGCTVCTFLVNWIFKRREYRLNKQKLELEYDLKMMAEQRKQAASDAYIAALRGGVISSRLMHPPHDTQQGGVQ